MDTKFKKATKRITAVAASAVMVSSAAFGAGLSNYPTNFVQDGKFNGQVVVGSAAAAMDTTSAQSIIDDLSAELSGEANKVKITYKDSTNGESVSAIDRRDTLNFGLANFSSIKETLDLDSTDVLADNDLDNEDYSQELMMGDVAEFNYRLWTELDEEVATDGLYFDNSATFATYTLDFDSALTGTDVSAGTDNTMVGEVLTIMGNEFTVVALTNTSMTLIGGADKISLGEGDSSSVSVSGNEYEVSIQSVSDTKVLLTVNGETKSIDEYETAEVGGVSIAVTDLVSSSRDAVKGYAEVVVGGQKVEIEESGNIKFNNEDLDDVFPEYEIAADWNGEVLAITYAIDDEVVLHAGDSLDDVLFDAFTLSYDGINDVDYSELVITSDSDSIEFAGNLYNGDAIPAEFALSVNDEGDDTVDPTNNFQLGTEDERIFFSGSNNTPITNNLGSTMTDVSYNGTSGIMTFNLNSTTLDIKDQLFFTQETDGEDMHLYQVTSHRDDGVDSEVSITDLIGTSTYNNRNADDLQSDLESNTFSAPVDGTVVSVNLTALSENNGETGTSAALYLENEMMMNFQEAENVTGAGHLIQFVYAIDATADDDSTLGNTINLSYHQKATDWNTDAVVLSVVGDEPAGDRFEVEEDSDLEMFVDAYGTRVTIDTDNNDMVKIEVPDEEVYGAVSFNFGERGSTMTVEVDADEADAKVASLESDGYTVVSTEEVEGETAEFDITAPVFDSDVSGMENMVVVGGPAVNTVAADLLGLSFPTYGVESGVGADEAVVRYFEDSNSVLVYGFEGKDTAAAAAKLNAGGLSGTSVNVGN